MHVPSDATILAVALDAPLEQLLGDRPFERCHAGAAMPTGHDVVVAADLDLARAARLANPEAQLVFLVRGDSLDHLTASALQTLSAHIAPAKSSFVRLTIDQALNDVAAQRARLSFAEDQRRVLEEVANQAPLQSSLEHLVLSLERQTTGLVGSIMLLAEEHGRRVLQTIAAPHLPPSFSAAIEGLEVGPTVGTCGAAAALGQRVVAVDISKHPNWRQFAPAAERAGLRACWSTPIFAGNEVVGTFAMYSSQPHDPQPDEFSWADEAASVAAIAIVADRSRRQQASLTSVLDASNDAFLVHTLDGRIQGWNKGAERLYGWAFAEVEGRPIAEFLLADVEQGQAACASVLEHGQFHGELAHRTRDGRIVDVALSCTLLRDRDKPTGILSIGTDITTKKNLERQLLRSQRLESLGTLAGGIAHDFNNILTAILGNLDLLDLGTPRRAASEALDDIRTAANRAAQLAKQILTFGRQGTAGRNTIKPWPVIEEAVRLLRATVPAMIELRLHAGVDLPDIRADSGQLHQVVMNLGTNAAQAIGNAGGSIDLSAERVELNDAAAQSLGLKPGAHFHLAVSDTGIGMSKETLDRAFEPFFTTKTHGQGTGLGLSVVLGIVRNHDGAIRARSTPGQGSTFDLYFPEAKKAAQRALSQRPPTRGKGQRVLYVDDETALVRAIARTLETQGYSVIGFERPSDAIEFAERSPDAFDVLVTDVAMPKMSGTQLASKLRELRPTLPIVLVSGNFRNEDLSEAQRLGVFAMINKPDIDGIAQALMRLFA